MPRKSLGFMSLLPWPKLFQPNFLISGYSTKKVRLKMSKLTSILQLTSQLADFKAEKDSLHAMLILTNRQVKAGEAFPESQLSLKAKIAKKNAEIRSLEHDLSLLTLTIMQTATIEETPYGRTIKYEQTTQENE